MFLRLIKDLRYVKIDPEPVNDKLSIHVLLLNSLALERREQEFKDADFTNLRQGGILDIHPGGIAHLPNHIAARLTVLAVLNRFDKERDRHHPLAVVH